jgi:hypothetical protein
MPPPELTNESQERVSWPLSFISFSGKDLRRGRESLIGRGRDTRECVVEIFLPFHQELSDSLVPGDP